MSYDAGFAAAVRELKEWETVARDLAAALEATEVTKSGHVYDADAHGEACRVCAALAAYRRLAPQRRDDA